MMQPQEHLILNPLTVPLSYAYIIVLFA